VERLAAETENTVVSRGVAVVLLLSSAVIAFIGMALMMWYNGSLSPRSTVFYPALYLPVFDFSVCALCFVGGVAALKRRFFPLTLAIFFLLLASGIATFIAGSWLFGLLFGLLSIVVSVAVLASLVALKAKK
jgi:peptidoglycan/LPS O-acetylase OafA/YrhL